MTAPPGAPRDGAAFAVATLRRLHKWENILQFHLAERIPSLTGLAPMQTVHFTRWSIVTLPTEGRRRPWWQWRPRHPYLLWESNYSGVFGPYVEAFVRLVSQPINKTWRTAYGFPGMDSVTQLTDYLNACSMPHAYYYARYPDATVRMVLAAQRVEAEHRYLLQAVRKGITAGEFAFLYNGFLQRRQNDL